VVTVLTDQALLDGHTIDGVKGGLSQTGKPDFTQPLGLQASQTWEVAIDKLSGPVQVVVKVIGSKGDKEILSNAAAVTLTPGKHTTVTLKLTAACAAATAPRCAATETCLDGHCVAVMVNQGDAGASDAGAGGEAGRDGPSMDRPGDAVSSNDSGEDGLTSPGDAETDVDRGGACTTDASCKSGHCVDGVCCDTACSGTCMACSAVFTGGTDGVCAPTKAGMNPHAARDCAAGKPEECGNDGTCDGAGACRLYGSTQTCAPASCTGAVGAQSFQPVSTCDGKGKCSAPAPQSCATYNCSPTSGCAKPCTTDDTCGAGNYCGADGICKTKQIDGNACTAAKECAHGFCVDGYCCESDCSKKGCYSCARDFTGQPNGQCQPVFKGKPSPRATDCKAADAKTCGLDGTCDGAGACKFFDSSTKCSDPSCTGSMFTATGSCDGTGKCGAGAKTDCGTFQCSLSGCLKNCQQDTDCNAGSYCTADKTCAVKKTPGTACQTTKECASGFCTDGVCCDSACNQTCYGCSLAKTGKTDGVCSPLKAGTSRNATECPASAMSTCGFDGTCDGAGKCHNWAQGSSCGAGACNASGFTGPKTCDGAGHCSGPAAVSCGAYPCDAATGCAMTCSSTQPCSGDTYCSSSGKCANKLGNGQACTTATQCLSGQCVEGFCCNSACTGGCSSCAKAKNGVADGTCSPIPNGQDPKVAGTCSANGCASDGKCDGANGCRKTPSGTSCGTAMCSVSNTGVVSYTSASACDGSGNCPAGSKGDCGGFSCASGSTCKTTCSVDNDCAAGLHCETGACKPDCKSQSDCGSNSICMNKRCASCGTGTKACNNFCVNTSNDKNNCGTCGMICSGSTSLCSGGSCKCTQNGDCGTNGVCNNGACISCGSMTACGAACVNTQNDSSNCGSCQTMCAAGQSCSRGKCACALGAAGCGKCLGWNFDSCSAAEVSGWSVSDDAKYISVVSSVSRSSSCSALVAVSGSIASIRIPLCSSTAVSSFQLYARLDGTQFESGQYSKTTMFLYDASDNLLDQVGLQGVELKNGQFLLFTGAFLSSYQASYAVFKFVAAFEGSMYLDDVSFN
jgi:hypothetical protein